VERPGSASQWQGAVRGLYHVELHEIPPEQFARRSR
jgi:hypothetical protein